jgi:hypothetical protein
MSVAFVLTCLIGMNQTQVQPVIGLSCGQQFATKEECQTTQESLANGVVDPFILAKCVDSPVGAPEEWCAPRTIMRVEPGKLTLTEDGSTEVLVYSAPFGAGLNGHFYIGKASLKWDLLLRTKVLMDSRAGHYWEPEIRIFRNRVFWQCKRPEDRPALTGVIPQ